MRWFMALVRLLLALLCIVGGAYGWFLGRLPHQLDEPEVVTDGLVVLTGEPARLDEAIQLLASGKAKRLLISGVNVDVSPAVLRDQLKAPEALFGCCVDLGYRARDTVGNATEAAQWADAHEMHTLRVITAAYHMPRGLAELHRAAPSLVLYSHPVFTAPAIGRSEPSPWGVPSEFAKYVVVLIRNRLDGIPPYIDPSKQP